MKYISIDSNSKLQNFTCSLKSVKTSHKNTRGTTNFLRTKFKSKKRKLNLKREKPTLTITSKDKGGPDLSNLDWIPLPTDRQPAGIYILKQILLFSWVQQFHEFSVLRRIDNMYFPCFIILSQNFSVGYLHIFNTTSTYRQISI